MKRLKLILLLIFLVAQPCFGAFTRSIDNRKTYKNSYRWTGRPKDYLLDWAQEAEDRLTGATAVEFMFFDPTDTEPGTSKGMMYMDESESKLRYYNGGSWVNIESGSAGNSLDGAYDVGNAITVDGSPVTLTTDTGSGITALNINHGGASNNNDGVTIAHAGSGDGIQVTVEDTDSVALRAIAAAAQTVSLAVFEGSTSNWDGADDVGMVHINTDDPLIHTGASLLYVVQSGTPIASAEGFLARFVQSGTAQTNATAVEIEVKATQPALAVNGITKINGQNAAGATLFQVIGVGASGNADAMSVSNTGSGDCLQISPGETDTGGINMVALAAGVVPLIIVDGVTNNWDGADDKGMINITHDTALIHAGASLLNINQTTAVKSDAEGFLARFVSDATAQASSFAVEIEVTNKQPALKVNNNVTISGADESGTLLIITHIGATGDADAMSIASSGSGDSLIISPTDVDSGGINMVGKAAGVVSLIKLDSATNNWDGANNVGQLLIDNDDAYVHAGASAIVVTDSSTPISAAGGFMARFVHSGTAQTNSSAVKIEVPTSQPALAMNGILAVTGQNSPLAVLVQITGNDASGNTDTMTINTEGTGDGLAITCDDADSVGLNVIAATSQTTSLAKFDGATGAYLGAQNVGMIHVTSDGALGHVDSSLMYIANSGVPQDDSRGSSLRIVDTGDASAGTAGYAVYISATDGTVEAMYIDTGNVLVDEEIVAGIGVQSTATGRTATVGGATTGLIARNTRHVTITCDDATKQITLPAPIIGMKITLVTPALGVELIATGSSVKVNDVIVSATNEAALVADSHYEVTCVSATEWILVGYDKLGAHIAPIVPDSL